MSGGGDGSDRPVPDHLVLAAQPRHGVSILARQLAHTLDARVVALEELHGPHAPGPGARSHLHFCDRLLAATPEDAAAAVEALAGRTRLTLTLHDVPAPTDGAVYPRRREAYRRAVAAAAAWATSSRTERDRVHDPLAPARTGHVVPLPVLEPRSRAPRVPVAPGEAVVGLLGWVYPGKGHEDVLRAAAALGDAPRRRPRVVALGRPAPGHETMPAELGALADELGVRWEVTGWLDDDALERAAAACHVGVAGHRNVSASGSVNSWVAAGHVPLVRAGDYAREMAALRPGTIALFEDDALATALAAALARPSSLPAGPLPWRLPEVAGAYRRWWRADG